MSKIRAYKLAEELGIDRAEFVEVAASHGIELKSAMASLTEQEAEQLRAKLSVGKREAVDERRVERSGSTTVIRRRKRAAPPEPPPAPEPVASAEEAPAEVAELPSAEPVVASEPAVDEAAAPESPPESPPEVERPAAAAAAPASDRAVPSEPAKTGPDRKGKQRKRVREVVNLREQEQFARQVTSRGGGQRRPAVVSPRSMVSPRSRRRDALPRRAAKPAEGDAAKSKQTPVIRVEGEISVGELAKVLGAKAAQIQGKLMALGTMVSVNQTVDVETARQVASEMGFEVQDVGFKEEEFLEESVAENEESENLRTRPPVITVMGHVDHGKTSLLDTIRKTKVAADEAGGITQHIGAYQTKSGDSTLTFIDTPGHAAFTAMRARGAQVTDMVVLVVAADDGVMPQTIEAIEHAQAAECPIVVAINKVDLPEADPDQTRQRLMEHGLVAEKFGGETIVADVSAHTGAGIDQLLEMLALQAEVLELKADPERRARGVVLEAELDKGRGPVATVLVQDGTLARGDLLVAGTHWGRVRVMEDHRGERVKEAGPSMPVQVVGLSGVPPAGAPVHAVESERVAKQITEHREEQDRSKPAVAKPRLTLEEFFAQSEGEEAKELSVVLKADVRGTCEAVRDSLEKLSSDRVSLSVLTSGVGGITENDVMLARASNAIVLGFHVRPDPVARRAAEAQGVDIRVYQLIQELLDDVKNAMVGLLPPTLREVVLGRAEVRETFTIPKVGTIAGCYITEGKVRRNAQSRLIRDGVQIYEGRVGSLKRFKDDAREVQTGFECGIGIEGYNDVKIGDVIEVFDFEEEPATL